MTVYVECEDPRVLADRWSPDGVEASHAECCPEWEAVYGVANVSPAWLERRIAEGWRYRLVFSDAEAAGKGLIDYRERLRARVLVSPEPGAAETQSVAPLSGDIVSALNGGSVYRIAAPTEEPRPEPWRAVIDGPCVEPRPALPEGVEPVAWSDRYGCWVLRAQQVPDGWEVSWGWVASWHGADSSVRRSIVRPLDLVLARPVPQPETERVPWADVVVNQRTLKGCGTHVNAVGYHRSYGGSLVYLSDAGLPLSLVHEPAIGWDGSGTVEVLTQGGEQ